MDIWEATEKREINSIEQCREHLIDMDKYSIYTLLYIFTDDLYDTIGINYPVLSKKIFVISIQRLLSY